MDETTSLDLSLALAGLAEADTKLIEYQNQHTVYSTQITDYLCALWDSKTIDIKPMDLKIGIPTAYSDVYEGSLFDTVHFEFEDFTLVSVKLPVFSAIHTYPIIQKYIYRHDNTGCELLVESRYKPIMYPSFKDINIFSTFSFTNSNLYWSDINVHLTIAGVEIHKPLHATERMTLRRFGLLLDKPVNNFKLDFSSCKCCTSVTTPCGTKQLHITNDNLLAVKSDYDFMTFGPPKRNLKIYQDEHAYCHVVIAEEDCEPRGYIDIANTCDCTSNCNISNIVASIRENILLLNAHCPDKLVE